MRKREATKRIEIRVNFNSFGQLEFALIV
uniref:Uncharacterized protein n=1 Tax=Rhizophora mucronata TaxID=61149 RepID=A0A2P2IPK0_RHIMU